MEQPKQPIDAYTSACSGSDATARTLIAADLGPAHRHGHRLYEISEAGAVVAKIAAEPQFVEKVLGAQLGKQTSLTKQPAAEMREPCEANAGCLCSDRPHSPATGSQP
jgi:hypothetical protein